MNICQTVFSGTRPPHKSTHTQRHIHRDTAGANPHTHARSCTHNWWWRRVEAERSWADLCWWPLSWNKAKMCRCVCEIACGGGRSCSIDFSQGVWACHRFAGNETKVNPLFIGSDYFMCDTLQCGQWLCSSHLPLTPPSPLPQHTMTNPSVMIETVLRRSQIIITVVIIIIMIISCNYLFPFLLLLFVTLLTLFYNIS